MTLLVAVDSLSAAEPCKTMVGGTIANQTWTREDSPYCVTNDVYVSGSLRIREGVEVRFNGNHVFEVAGRLRAEGTAEAPVQFHPANPAVGWQGLLFRDAVPGSYFVHTIIEGSKNSGVRITTTAPSFTKCVFRNNTSDSRGGGIDASTAGGDGLVLNECVFTNNIAVGSGGAIHLQGLGSFTACLIASNACTRSDSWGGGVYFDGNQLRMVASMVENNRAGVGGGVGLGTGTFRVSNTILRRNTAYRQQGSETFGGGLCIYRTARAEVVNCAILENQSDGIQVWDYNACLTLTNSIVYHNPIQINGVLTCVAVAYSDIQGRVWPGPGNISVSPALCPDNYSLIEGSPCIDAGHPGLEFRDGCRSDEPCSPFARGTSRNDMGAYGGSGVCYWTQPRAEPVLRIAPDNEIGFMGQPVSLGVIATGAEPLVYQWFKNGVPLIGRTNMVLTLPNSTLADAGAYVVEVTNPLGEAVSLPVQLGIAKYECVPQGFSAGRPRLLIRHGQVGERCVLYSIGRLPAGDTLAVPGNPPEGWEVRETIVFSAPEVEWTDPQVLGAGETRYYGVLPAL